MFNNDTISYLLSEQVRKTPDNTALVYEDSRLSYKELEERSNQMANYLIKQGVNKGALIPVCIERSFDMIIGILGIVKSGAAYVPLDPKYPSDRITYILEQTGDSLVITSARNKDRFSGPVVVMEEISTILDQESVILPDPGLLPQDLLYIIYTSGSTGKPKGVMVEHRSLVSYIGAQRSFFGITENERILQFSNYCFDASIEQIFMAFLSGACLVLVREEILRDMDAFSVMLLEKAITHLHATPGFLENLPEVHYPDLKRIVSAGDVCKIELFKRWAGKTDFYNKYGPTEATISILEYHCTLESSEELKTLPIGKPIAGVDVYLLDEDLKEVPVGTTGQIYAGGVQVVRGYINASELTDASFIKNPFRPDSRIYKTGDMGRMLPDGNIEFIGRMDDQVKIRGFRIELGEVENTLRSAPEVNQCVVITVNEGPADKKLVAYVVTEGKTNQDALREYLASKLPEYMVPQLFVSLDSLPLTANGKVNRRALPDPDASELLSTVFTASKYETEKMLTTIWQDLLHVKKIGTSDNFFELGGNSLLAQKLVMVLKERDVRVPVTKLYQFPTILRLAAFLDGRTIDSALGELRSRRKGISRGTESSDIAIVGMACRFPGANTVQQFWNNIVNKRESIHFFSDDELDPSIPDAIRNNPAYVKARGIIDEPAAFDPAFFGINPKLAELMDPQQRIFLEVAWEALEHSGQVSQHFKGIVGVYGGCRFNTYYTHNVLPNTERIAEIGAFQIGTVNDKDYIASRTAYALDLKGPAVNVQSACSTSLLAVAEAVEAIRNGYCDVALAGASSILVPINNGHLYEEGAMLSNDGHCRAFDADARGTVFSDGTGVVVLKNKAQAERDGDPIYAVIKGVGLSNDGGAKGSFTAPSADGQAAAIAMAMEDADVLPENISYIETHGTATPIGDPIEINGLNIAFGLQEKKQFCAIGSVKSNIGHLTSASGVAGLIKTSMALYQRQLPPSINFEQPNPHIDFENSPFFVNTTLVPWVSDKKRLAGISSFGVGGTNVHLILEESAQTLFESGQGRPVELFCWSAKAATSLDGYGEKLSTYLGEGNISLADAAYTLRKSREDFNYRRFIVANSAGEFLEKVKHPVGSNTKNLTERAKELVFMFPGQGSQYINMGKDLYEGEPVFRQAMDECAALLHVEMNENILEVIYPVILDNAAENKLKNTRYSQPALFSIGYALGKLWMSWDIFPTALIGHSIGEFVAAHFAGVLSLVDALKLISSRGRMMADLPEGCMLSVRTDEQGIREFLSEEVSLAAVNSPNLCVLAGTDASIAAVIKRLDDRGILNRLLPTSHAFHSYLMDPVIEPFRLLTASVVLSEPVIPFVSTVTGNWLSKEEATDPVYWAKHLRSTVFFGKATQKLMDEGYTLFAELGPGNSATTLTRQQAAGKSVVVVNSLDKKDGVYASYYSMLNAVGLLWLNGLEPNWILFYANQRRSRLNDLPTYAFNHKNYWVYPPAADHAFSNIISPSWPESTLRPVPVIKQSSIMRKQVLIEQIKEILENASGIDMAAVKPDMTFIEVGMDSLLLTQVALSLKKKFAVPVTFRQLNENYDSLELLAAYLDEQLPEAEFQQMNEQTSTASIPLPVPAHAQNGIHSNYPPLNGVNNTALDLISQQLQLLARQLSLLQGGQTQLPPFQQNNAPGPPPAVAIVPTLKDSADLQLSPEEAIEIRKPFGAAARIERQSSALTEAQQKYLADLILRYNGKTKASKAYTQEHRAYMADPRVVSGFRPATKELVYSIVINRSKGSRLWDIDGNEYIDALNGFGSNMLGYQPDFIKKALIDQIEKGYEIGPQHELSGEVSKLICEFTGFDRTGLCNTGSEAVLGAMRIARTVTGRSIIVAFSGSYHGIADEVIVRGSKKLKTFPASPGIMPEAVQNMLILDYGTDEALRIIEERAEEIAAVLVEPVQSRRCDFQPLEFLKKLRTLTEKKATVLIFDEVISGFRFHPGGVQSMFGIRADIGTYGKVAGGGISIGIIAGKKQFMDALDGGFWKFGDASIPETGVTYFAGTFVRHPLALATAKASLTYLKEKGPQLQENLNANGKYVASTLNGICRRLRVPIFIAQFGSLWRIRFLEEYPYNELFFTLMRYKGIHILEGFSCFLTTAHSSEDILQIIKCFEESLIELKEAQLIPEFDHVDLPSTQFENMNIPPAPNARLGKDRDGNPAWFVEDMSSPGKYLQISL
jgi:amino acid adenylation domain-containing protein